MRKLEFMKKLGFIIGIIVLLMAVMPMSDGLVVQAQPDMEFGDAPDLPFWIYPSLLASGGVHHVPTFESEILGLGITGLDSKDFEPDARNPDLDIAFDDGLNTLFIGAGNPAATVTFEVTDFLQGGPTLYVNILIDLNIDGDWSDPGEHVVVDYMVPCPSPGEWVGPSPSFSTVGATPGWTFLRLTLTRTPIGGGWDGTVPGPFMYGETEDWEILIEPSDLPDLIVDSKGEEVIGCEYYVFYTVLNNGNGPAGPSITCIYANDDPDPVATAPCPPLLPGEWDENSVGPLVCPGTTTVWIEVCADNYDDVEESNEENNCWWNEMYQPLEFGDAEDPLYPSLLKNDGSRHCPTDTEILGLGLSGQDCKDFELDALITDNDACCDGLVTTMLAAGDPAATVTFEVTNFIAADDLIVNILLDLNQDGDWTDAGEHVVKNQAISLPGPDEGTFTSDSFSTVGAKLGETWLRLTLTRTPVTVPWDGTGLFECGETEDWKMPMWYWKPNQTDYAPSGMPDFDQKQDEWGVEGMWTYCGPVSVANSLWWFDSREETGGIPPPDISDSYPLVTAYGEWDDHNPQNVEPLVNNLSQLMNTDGLGWPYLGTDVYDMQEGIEQFLVNAGLDDYYYEKTVKSPDFYWIEEEVERCEDVILLLGFWQFNGEYWYRFGGHYVTCAGVNSEAQKLAICDPFFDNFEAGLGPGRMPVWHPSHPFDGTVHNDTQYVSHDIYDVIKDPCPGGNWSLKNYTDGKEMDLYDYFIGQNWAPELEKYFDWYEPGYPVHTQIDYAVAVSPGEWYWKPNQTDYAPSGMPDFDQKQSGWYGGEEHWSCCGPVAVANSLWWFDSREENGGIPPPDISDSYPLVTTYGEWDDHDPQNVEPLVWDLILNYMNTDEWNGTDVYDMQDGINQYLIDRDLDDEYYEVTVKSPDFYWIEEEVERCEDVILLLGFWLEGEGWIRIGGHYVTCAGVNSEAQKLGISDPFFDNAEATGQPRVPVPHDPHPFNGTVHNNATLVSHDIYDVIWDPCPGGNWSLKNYTDGKEFNLTNFIGQNSAPELEEYFYDWYEPYYPVHTQIDYAVAVSPITATLEGHVDLSRYGGAGCTTWITPLVVSFFDNATQNETDWSPINRTTDAQGNFTIEGIPTGTYDIAVKNWTTLSKMELNKTFNSTITIDFGLLTEGDTDNDDFIKGGDYNDILTRYFLDVGDPLLDPNKMYDFDRSGKVSGFDYNQVLTRYFWKGDLYKYQE